MTRTFLTVLLAATSLGITAGCGKSDPNPTKPKLQASAGVEGVNDVGQSSGAKNGSSSDRGAKEVDDRQATKPEFKTSAKALVKEILANGEAASAKYGNKVVEIEGEVDSANKILGNNRHFSLVGEKKTPDDVLALNVLCIPAAGQEKAWWVGKGQKVKVVGLVTSTSSVFGIGLDRCVVTEVGPNPTPTVTAEAIAGEFAKDPESAMKKYTDSNGSTKEIIVEGTVGATGTRPDGRFPFVELVGKDGYTVRFSVERETIGSVKKGDKATMKGNLSFFDKDKKQLTVDTAFLLKKG